MPRFAFTQLPSPLHRLDCMSDHLGIDLWVKREDQLGFAMGGNKVRKVEYLVAYAKAIGATRLISAGAVQSNHARVVATAAAVADLNCTLVLSGTPPTGALGNLLLDRLAGADVRFVASGDLRNAEMERVADEARSAGEVPYVIPIGGSNAVGAEGYVAPWTEIAEEVGGPFTLISATSSGGTLAGLYAGWALSGREGEIVGIRVDLDPGAEETIADLATQVCRNLGASASVSADEVNLNSDFVGQGYGIPTPEALAAIQTLWRTEGILLDPVYSGKAFAGLISLAQSGAFTHQPVVFLHTGGAPGALALGEGLLVL